MEINRIGVLLFLCTSLLGSCNRELDLEHRYDNSQSSKPFEEEKPEDELEYTDKGLYSISERVTVSFPTNIPRSGYFPDGKLSVCKLKGEDTFTSFWSGDCSFMQTGCKSPWFEDNIGSLNSSMAVIGKGVSPVTDGFTDGGMWLIGVHELSDGRLAGFFHAESHFPGVASQYKSIGLSYSSDGGRSWDAGCKIISGPEPKPEQGEGGGKSYGLGDGCVVWNEAQGKWICYYSGYCDNPGDFVISMAASDSPVAEPSSWKKWDGDAFNTPACDQESGLGAPNIKIKNLDAYHGGNPSVCWNSAFNKWLMCFHSWGRELVLSMSDDGIVWSRPAVLLGAEDEPGGAMYPNFLSENGDLECAKEFRIYYAADMDNSGKRQLCYRVIKLK